MKTDPKARALEVCLQKFHEGTSLEGSLDLYPQWRNELQALLETAQLGWQIAADLHVYPEDQARGRDQFLRAIDHPPKKARPRRAVPAWLIGAFLTILILGILVAVAWSVVQSAQALPGETYYPLKNALQQAHLLITMNPSRRLDLEEVIDREKLSEVDAMRTASLAGAVRFSGGLSRVKQGKWTVGDIIVDVPEEAEIVGDVQTGYFVEVDGTLQEDGKFTATRIGLREYIIEGRVQDVLDEGLLVEGIKVGTTPQTLSEGDPDFGKKVRIRAVRDVEGNLEARFVEVVGQ